MNSKTVGVLPAAGSRLLNEKEVAMMAGVSTSWLQKLRMRGDGPKFYKLGKAVRRVRRSPVA